jgi:hypothetical protein
VRGAGWPTFAFVLMLFVVVVVSYVAIPAQIKYGKYIEIKYGKDIIDVKLNKEYDEDKDTCKDIRRLIAAPDTCCSYVARSGVHVESKPRRYGFEKMKLVYFRYQSDSNKVMAMAVAMPVLFVLFVVIFVAMAAHKRYKTQEDRVYGRQQTSVIKRKARTNVKTSSN